MYLQAGRHRFAPFPLPLSPLLQRLVPAEGGGSIRKICAHYFLKTTNSFRIALARPSLSRRTDRSRVAPKFFCNDMRHWKGLGVCLQKSQPSSHGSPADLPRQERLRTNRLQIRIAPLLLPGPLSFRAYPGGSLPKEGRDTQICESELSFLHPKRCFLVGCWGSNISDARCFETGNEKVELDPVLPLTSWRTSLFEAGRFERPNRRLEEF
jgi:hypothetical protein